MAGGRFGDDPADAGRAGEIDTAYRRMRDQRLDDLPRILRRIGNGIQHAFRQAGLMQGIDDEPVRARADFRGLHHHGVAAGKRRGDRTDTQDDGRVPRRHGKHDAGRLADGHCKAAGPVGRDHLAGDLRRHRRRLAQHVGGKTDVEHRPARRGTGLLGHCSNEFRRLRLQPVGGGHQQLTALARACCGPGRKCLGGDIGGLTRVIHRRRGDFRGNLTGNRVHPLEIASVGRFHFGIVDLQAQYAHAVLHCPCIAIIGHAGAPRKARCTARSFIRFPAVSSPVIRPASAR